MAIKTFTTGEVLTAADTNTYLANSGLVFVKSQTIGNGVSSVTVSDAFSSTYDNYQILISGGVGNQSAELFMRLGATVTNYYFNFIYTAWNTSVAADASKTGTRFQYVGGMTTNNISAKIDVLSPNLPKDSRVFAGGFGDSTSYVGVAMGALFNTSQYTSFDIFPGGSGNTMTGGTITVYGYRKA
jgi:hypothetical protein